MKLYIASDHAGFDVKENLKRYLKKKNIKYEDLGADRIKPDDDYVDYAVEVGEKVAKSPKSIGILICGSGIGMSIAANKVKGIRAVNAYDTYTAVVSRQDNNANVLCLRGRKFSFSRIKSIVTAFLNTGFTKIKRHERRIKKIKDLEK
ncbi:MAG: RpiB/LacA/LacB family sugar-phosphate isomerase [Candidatus Woesearchaeota archaeon]